MNAMFRILAALALIGVWQSPVPAQDGPSEARIVHRNEKWRLLVNGKPYFILGVGVNQATGQNGEDYLRMAKELGANTVRTWGGAPKAYLDKAWEYGLRVNLGVWLNPIRETGGHESYLNEDYRERLRAEILDYVREMKDHPALLMWNIGNEALAFTYDAAERKALAEFLESLVQDVHRLDPLHPTTYACSQGKELPELLKSVPSLDVIGTNIYGSLSPVLGWLRNNGHDKPVVVTEFGPLGAWDMPKDRNGQAYDPMDHLKSNDYASIWRQIEAARDKCLGGFAFVLGDLRNQTSLSWYNLNFGDLRRDTYWTIYKGYRKKNPPNRAPKFSEMSVSKSGGLRPGEMIEVHAVASDPEEDPITYRFFVAHIVDDPVMVEPPKYVDVKIETLGPGQARIEVPAERGDYRVYVLATDTKKNAAIINRSLEVVPAPSHDGG